MLPRSISGEEYLSNSNNRQPTCPYISSSLPPLGKGQFLRFTEAGSTHMQRELLERRTDPTHYAVVIERTEGGTACVTELFTLMLLPYFPYILIMYHVSQERTPRAGRPLPEEPDRTFPICYSLDLCSSREGCWKHFSDNNVIPLGK